MLVECSGRLRRSIKNLVCIRKNVRSTWNIDQKIYKRSLKQIFVKVFEYFSYNSIIHTARGTNDFLKVNIISKNGEILNLASAFLDCYLKRKKNNCLTYFAPLFIFIYFK